MTFLRFLHWILVDDHGRIEFGGLLRTLVFVLIALFLISCVSDVIGIGTSRVTDVTRSSITAH